MRRFGIYFFIVLHSGLVACSGSVGSDPIVIEYCTEMGNSKSVCSCAAKKLKTNTSEDVYNNYIEVLHNLKNLSEQHNYNFEQEAENGHDFLKGIGALIKIDPILKNAIVACGM